MVQALRREWMRLLRKGRRVQLVEPGPERDEQLHEVRKAAKRVKDLADAQTSVSGRKVRRLGKAADRLKNVLGEHQDLVVTGALLETAVPGVTGADGVVHRIQSRETAAAGELYGEFVRIFRDADRKSLRAWMS
jgi:CHAD domain-containing protein